MHEHVGIDWAIGPRREGRREGIAPGRPVPRPDGVDAPRRGRGLLYAAPRAQHGVERTERLTDIRLYRDLGRIVLGEVGVALADLHDRHSVRKRGDRSRHRHTKQVGTKADQEVIYLETTRDLTLIAAEHADIAVVGRDEGGGGRHRVLVDRGAEQLRQLGRSRERAAGVHFMAADEHRAIGREEATRQGVERRVGRTVGRVDAVAAPEIDLRVVVEHIARQRDEHRSGRRGQRDLRRASHHPRKIEQPRHLDRPFDERTRARLEPRVEHRFGQAMSYRVLSRRHDDRRPDPVGVVQRADGIPEAGSDVHVAHGEASARARIAIGHRHDDRFLRAQHVVNLGEPRQRRHQRQFGRSRVAEQMGNPFVDQEREKCGATAHRHESEDATCRRRRANCRAAPAPSLALPRSWLRYRSSTPDADTGCRHTRPHADRPARTGRQDEDDVARGLRRLCGDARHVT